jgi:hypothetical protein
MKFVLCSVLSTAIALGSGVRLGAQDQVETDPQLRFEENVLVVTAMPRHGTTSDHFMTFSAPVHIPGATLAAGTYLFRFPDGGKNTIQVLKADEFGDDAEVYSLFHTIDTRDISRGLTTDTYAVTLHPREAAGTPPAIDKWFIPHYSEGFEFIYPES